MSIDWFTFIAQIVNFLILVALLHRFLYGPIVNAMQQRELQIAARLREADLKHDEADGKVMEYANLTQELEEKRDELLRDARREARDERERLEGEARRDVQDKRDEWFEGLQRAQSEWLSEFRTQSAELSVAIAKQTLRQLADASLEEQMLSRLLIRLQHLDVPRRTEILSYLADREAEVSVRTTFEISAEWKRRLHDTIRSVLEYEGVVEFETSAELVCGIELDIGGYMFGWNVQQALREMSSEMTDWLKHNV